MAVGLSADRERGLIHAVQVGDPRERERACRKLLKAFEPLVGSRVWQFSGQGLDNDELAQIARIGFLRAVQRFDLDRSTRLASYAMPWIEGALRRAVTVDPNQIQLPERVIRKARRVWVAEGELTAALGRVPTRAELAEWLEISVAAVEAALSLPRADVALGAISDGEVLVQATRSRPDELDRRMQARLSDAEEEVASTDYSEVELRGLLEDYKDIRSSLEFPPPPSGEPRLRRHSKTRDLCRLTDLDGALGRVPGRVFIELELIGIHDLSLRALERLLQVRHTTLADRYKRGITEVTLLLNGGFSEDERPLLRGLWWRDVHASTVGDSFWVYAGGEYEPIALEIWARLGHSRSYGIDGQVVLIRDVPNGDGWLITPELLGLRVRWDDPA